MIPPSKFAHIVYRTNRYEAMIDWYVKVFGATVQHRDHRIAFLTYDDEHHRFAIANLGEVASDDEIVYRPGGGRRGVGVDHVAYTWDRAEDLLAVYQSLKAIGVLPVHCVKHGPTFSMYYDDPDQNRMEFQVDVLEGDAANEYMAGAEFAKNPIGEKFDPDGIVARLEAGETADRLVLRSDQLEQA